MKSILDALTRAALVIAGVSLLTIALVQAWQVFARYVLNDSPGWTEPLALFLMNITMMFGAAVSVRRDQHFSFSLLQDAVAPTARKGMRILAAAVPGLIGAALAWGGAILMHADWDVPMAGAAMPEGLRYLPLCIGGALMAIFAVERVIDLSRTTATEP